MLQWFEGKGECKVTQYDYDVNNLTLAGWELIGVMNVGEVECNYIDVPDPTAGYIGATKSQPNYIPINTVHYILRKDEESTLGAAQQQLDRVTKELTAAKKELREIEESGQDTRTKIATVKKQYEDILNKSEEEYEGKLREYELKVREMEKDLTAAQNTTADQLGDVAKAALENLQNQLTRSEAAHQETRERLTRLKTQKMFSEEKELDNTA